MAVHFPQLMRFIVSAGSITQRRPAEIGILAVLYVARHGKGR